MAEKKTVSDRVASTIRFTRKTLEKLFSASKKVGGAICKGVEFAGDYYRAKSDSNEWQEFKAAAKTKGLSPEAYGILLAYLQVSKAVKDVDKNARDFLRNAGIDDELSRNDYDFFQEKVNFYKRAYQGFFSGGASP